MNTFRNSFRNILFYPSALVGILVVFLLIFTAVYAMIKIPYNEAIRLWRGGECKGCKLREECGAPLDEAYSARKAIIGSMRVARRAGT